MSVRDSDASGGQELVADSIGSVYSANLGNNVNWRFIIPAGTLVLVR